MPLLNLHLVNFVGFFCRICFYVRSSKGGIHEILPNQNEILENAQIRFLAWPGE